LPLIVAPDHRKYKLNNSRHDTFLQGFENPYTNLKGIEKHPNGNQKTTPLLIISNGAYYFTVLGEIYYDVA
jgi:hypothetical protein